MVTPPARHQLWGQLVADRLPGQATWNIYSGPEHRFVCSVRAERTPEGQLKLHSIGNRLSQDTWRRIKALVETDLGLRPPPDTRHQPKDSTPQ